MASQLTRRTALSVEHELTKSGGPRGRTHHDQRKAPGRRGVRTPSNREKPSDTALSLSLHLSLSPLAKATVASKEERAELCASSSPSPFFPIIIPMLGSQTANLDSKRKGGRSEFHERASRLITR